MNKDEILEKSRAENKNKDIYEQEILKPAPSVATIVLMFLATVFFVIQIVVGGGINYGLYALVISVSMSTYWVKYIKLRKGVDLCLAIVETVVVIALTAVHIYNLISPSLMKAVA